MKKFLSILSIFLIALIAIVAAGCITDDPVIDDPEINGSVVTDLELNDDTVTVDPLPEGFTLLAVMEVVASEDIIGVADEWSGLSGYYSYNGSNAYLSVFVSTNTSTAIASINQAKAEVERINGEVSTVTINGHNATLLKTTSTTGDDKFVLIWNVDNWIVFVDAITGQPYDTVKTLAEASGL